MALFAKQRHDNTVIGIDAEGLIQRLLLFDHCIVPSIWLKDVQLFLRMVDPVAFCELIDAKALSFYIDTSTAVEMGQARSGLNLTGNTKHLKDNEFSFATIRGQDDVERRKKSIDELARTEGLTKKHALDVAERVEAALLQPKGLEIYAESFKAFFRDLRAQDSTTVQRFVARRLKQLGPKPKDLEVSVEEFVLEDFRINSNLESKYGLPSKRAREVCQRALFDLLSVHIRLEHMREFSCIMGMNNEEEEPWEMKVDSLVQNITRQNRRVPQFTRVATIAGLAEKQLIEGGRIDLRRIIALRHSDDLTIFRRWLKTSTSKSDEEIRERVLSIRNRIGNTTQGSRGKVIRLMLSCLTSLIPNPGVSLLAGSALGAADLFLLERAFPKDAVVSVLGTEYPSIFKK